MSAGRDVRHDNEQPGKRPEADPSASALMKSMKVDALAAMDDIEEPSAADLAALEAMDAIEAEEAPHESPESIQAHLLLLEALQNPEMDPMFGSHIEQPGKRAEADPSASALLKSMMGDVLAALDDIEEPSAADLAALDDIEEPSAADLAALEAMEAMDAEEAPLVLPEAMLSTLEEPELVSLEGLEDADDTKSTEEDLIEEDEQLVNLLENYADHDLDDDDIDDEGYDLDDDDIDHYQDLYGEDGDIIPSFREGETDDEDECDIAYYDDMR